VILLDYEFQEDTPPAKKGFSLAEAIKRKSIQRPGSDLNHRFLVNVEMACPKLLKKARLILFSTPWQNEKLHCYRLLCHQN